MNNTVLSMWCEILPSNVPLHALPAGYSFRTFRLGQYDSDEQAWLTLQRATEPFKPIEDDDFATRFGLNRTALPSRLFFVTADVDMVVGTIAAWYDWGNPQVGRIHWVAVHPDHQGKGIGNAMMTVAMLRLACSHKYAMLTTSALRTNAIRLYLKFGFVPTPRTLKDRDVLLAWLDVQAQISSSFLLSYLEERRNDPIE